MNSSKPQSKATWFFVGAILFAIIAAWSGYTFLKAQRVEKPVVIAVQAIEPYTPITNDNVAVKKVSPDGIQNNTYVTLDEIIGWYATSEIPVGAQIRSEWLVDTIDTRAPLAAKLQQHQKDGGEGANYRAMTVPLTQNQGLTMIQAGDKIDLVATAKLDRDSGDGDTAETTTFTTVLAHRVPVLDLYNPQTDDNSSSGTSEGYVVLRVNPQLALDIEYARANGTLIVLNTPYETTVESINPTTRSNFMQRYGFGVETTPQDKGAMGN